MTALTAEEYREVFGESCLHENLVHEEAEEHYRAVTYCQDCEEAI